jgi:anti-anti-sigma factor
VNSFQVLLSHPSDDVLVLNLSGELDLGTATPLKEATKAALASGDYRLLVFDLTHLDFMDSTGLHVIAKTHRAMVAAGGTTKVVCASQNMMRVFELTGLVGILTFAEDRAGALAGYAVAA